MPKKGENSNFFEIFAQKFPVLGARIYALNVAFSDAPSPEDFLKSFS